jgi:hypothetical protein
VDPDPARARPQRRRSELASTDYRRATIGYLNASGYEVNVASPGGHINASEYDKFGNQVRELSARNRALALGGSGEATAELTALGISGLAAAERAQLLSDLSIYDDEGTRLVEQLGPVHRIGLEKPVMRAGVTLAAAGTEVVARSRTVNEYDAGRPTDGTAVLKNQVTKVTIGAQLREHPELLVETRVSTTESRGRTCRFPSCWQARLRPGLSPSVRRSATRIAGGQYWNGGDLLVGQVLPVQAARAARRTAGYDFIWGHDQVDTEVVLGLGQVVVDDLEPVHGRHDGCAWPDEVGLLQQSNLDVGVAGALAEADARAVDRDTAADDEVHRPQLVHGDLARCGCSNVAGCGFGWWHGEGGGIE